MLETSSARRVLGHVGAERRAFEKARELYSDRLAPKFSPFEFIKTDELGFSRLLGWLLDWEGSHGQGAGFLSMFLDTIGVPWTLADCERSKVRLEMSIGGDGRIDIIVSTARMAVVIENKPFAADQDQQIARYFNYLEQRSYERAWIVYLTAGAVAPAEHSIDKDQLSSRLEDGRLILAGYRTHLLGWIDRCYANCKADRVSTFLQQFKQQILLTFEGVQDMSEQGEIISAMTETDDALLSAIQIINAKSDLHRSLFQKLRVDLEKMVLEQGWKLVWQVEEAKRYTGISIDFSDGCAFVCRIEFDELRYRSAAYGVVLREPAQSIDPEVFANARSAVIGELGSGRSGAPWIWWSDQEERDPFLPIAKYWDVSPQPWIAIRNGSLARQFIDVTKIASVGLQKAGLA